MAKQATTKIDKAAAEQFGRMAFRAGVTRAPACDEFYNAFRKEKYPNSAKAVVELGSAWLGGWDSENRKTPVAEA